MATPAKNTICLWYFSVHRAIEALETVRLVTFRMDDRPERCGVSGGFPDARQVLKDTLHRLDPKSTPNPGVSGREMGTVSPQLPCRRSQNGEPIQRCSSR
jgi:hypothetical protein